MTLQPSSAGLGDGRVCAVLLDDVVRDVTLLWDDVTMMMMVGFNVLGCRAEKLQKIGAGLVGGRVCTRSCWMT